MWHYVEGIRNWNPIWPGHGIRILPGPSSLWLDATGRRLPVQAFVDHGEDFVTAAIVADLVAKMNTVTGTGLLDPAVVVLGSDGLPVAGLYAAGEVAGFGGGGMHGYRALEGAFLGGCLFSGRTAGARRPAQWADRMPECPADRAGRACTGLPSRTR